MDKQELISILTERKNSGASVSEAVKYALRSRAAVSCSILAQAIMLVYSTTPLELALTLKEAGFDDINVAKGICEAIASISAVSLGAVILNKNIFPDTAKARMNEILPYCGYSDAEIAKAVKILYPAVVIIDSRKPWQKTGVKIEADEIVSVKADGLWKISPQLGSTDANGSSWFIGKEGYAMPGKAEGALVGRLGSELMLIGKSKEILAGKTGELELCPNDDLESKYGAGLADNVGKMTVTITVRLL